MDGIAIHWASNGEIGIPAPPEFTLIRVAEILNCSVFDLLKEPLRWRKTALLYDRVQARYPEVKEKIEKQRARVRGESPDDDNEKA